MKKIINIKDIDDFKNHPFLVERTNLEELIESIRDNGLLVPLVVREKEGGRHEMISGHRRKIALEILEIKEVEVEVKELSDKEAIIYMVDSNLYREKLLPSEKAFAYKMKLDAIKHQGKKSTCTYDMSKSLSFVGKKSNDSREKVRKYIRLTFLIPELLKIVDDTVKTSDKHKLTMGILPAVELSYLSIEEQKLVYSVITYEDRNPSHGQTKLIRKLSVEKNLNFDSVEKILTENKGNQREQISFNKDRIVQALPFNIVKRDKRYIEAYIINAIKEYKNNKFNIHNFNFD